LTDSFTNSPLAEKALPDDFLGRFREIISDPINLLIPRAPSAGMIKNGMVCLHNGIYVPLEGEEAYFGKFSEVLVINRGVHEPLEEFVFQELLKILPTSPISLELGAYWAHYSMWLKQVRPNAFPILVEPDDKHLLAGINNFRRNNFSGEFIKEFVGHGQFEVDSFLKSRPGLKLNLLHSDIDLHEMSMLRGAVRALSERLIDYLFISTHSQSLHTQVVSELEKFGYRIEVSSDFDHDTTSFDGFVMASSPEVPPLFNKKLEVFGRLGILQSEPTSLLGNLKKIRNACEA